MAGGIRIGLAGLGYIGKIHLAQYRALGIEAFTADPGVTAEEAADLGSAGHYRHFKELLEQERPGAADICLPSYMHKDSALEAFAHGADVLMEKPFALTLKEIDAITSAARAAGRRIMVAHVCRFMAQYTMAKELVLSGRAGKPVFLNAWRNTPTPMWSANNWLGDRKSSGGTVMDLQIHEIDLARWLLGEPGDAALMMRQCDPRRGSAFFHAVANLSFEGGAAATLEAGHLMPKGYPHASGYRLLLEEGSLEFNEQRGESCMHLYEPSLTTDLTPEFRARSEGRDPYREEIRHFLECLATGREFTVTVEEARGAVETALLLLDNEIIQECVPTSFASDHETANIKCGFCR